MAQDLALKVLLLVDSSQSSKISGFGSMLGGLEGPLGAAALGAVALGAGILAVGAKSVQMAAAYQQSMDSVRALTGSSQAQMAQYDQGLKALAVEAGVAPLALSKGLYFVISAGYQGADAMNVLTLATKDAKIGMTDSATTADALTNVLKSFTWQTKDANLVNGIMLQTVTLGKATFEQYASTISKASTTASQFHISLQTMSAAWATMTSNGIRAKQATTDFVQVVQSMYGKVDTITKSLHKHGIAFNETAFNAMDFGHKVEYLNNAMQEAVKKHVQITGVTLQAAQALQVLGQHSKDYTTNLAILSDKQAMAKKTQEAWAITQGGFSQTMDRVKAAIDVLLINIGQKLLPYLTKIAAAIAPVIAQFADWISKSDIIPNAIELIGKAVGGIVGVVSGLVTGIGNLIGWIRQGSGPAQALGTAIGILGGYLLALKIQSVVSSIIAMIPQMGVWLAATWAQVAALWAQAAATIAATWPILLVIGIIAGLILIIKNWGAISGWLKGVWSAFSSWFGGAMSAVGTFFHHIWDDIAGFFKMVWSHILDIAKIALIALLVIITGPVGAIVLLIITHWNQIHSFLQGAWNRISNLARDGMNFIINAIKSAATNLWNAITAPFKKAYDWVTGLFSGLGGVLHNVLANMPLVGGALHAIHIPGFATGTQNFSGGMAIVGESGPELITLPPGSNVYPLNGIKGNFPSPSYSGSANGSGATHITYNNIYINAPNADAKQVAYEVKKLLGNELRRSGSLATITSGGKVAS